MSRSPVRQPIEPAFERDAPWMRLQDIISGLQNQQAAAFDLIGRIDPAVMDELNAMVVHRRISLADYVADALMQVALEAADAAWASAVRQRLAFHQDAEAALMGHLLNKAMRRRWHERSMIASDQPSSGAGARPTRVGQPYGAD